MRLFGRGGAAGDAQDEDFSWMVPPETMVDAAAWDRYWHDQVTHGIHGLVDLFCDDGPLVDVMRASGFRTVLCVGNGISQEPRALARAGFDVTALDLSPLATAIAKEAAPPLEFLATLVGGRPPTPNGHVEFVLGDLRDAACCPGPYDVVIDRRTLQLYPDGERAGAMRAVASRVATPGIFFSHCHDGGWRPPAPRRHASQSWFVAEGWRLWQGETSVNGQLAWLLTTTG